MSSQAGLRVSRRGFGPGPLGGSGATFFVLGRLWGASWANFGASWFEDAFLERFLAIFCIFVLIFGEFGEGLGMIFGRFVRMFVKNAIL